jgi:hypothetical protein
MRVQLPLSISAISVPLNFCNLNPLKLFFILIKKLFQTPVRVGGHDNTTINGNTS